MSLHLAADTAHRERLDRDGFLVVDRPLVDPLELADAQAVVDGVMSNYDQMPPSTARDLGDVKVHPGPPRIAEVMGVLRLAPELQLMGVYAAMGALAMEVLGGAVVNLSDHAIYKSAGDGPETGWHQDLAYARRPVTQQAITVWLPLQAVTTANGCMEFVPGSHHLGLLAHHRLHHDERAHALVTDEVDPTVAVACPLPAGGATVHWATTLHRTGPNRTDTVRRAWITTWCLDG